MMSVSSLIKFLRHPIEHMKTAWESKNPFGKWNSLFVFTSFWGSVAQLEVFSRRPNGPIMRIGLFICIFSSFLIGYTSYYYILIGEFSKVIPAYCMTGIMASTYAVAWNLALKDRMKWVPLLEMAGQHIYRDDKRPTAYNRICSECMDQTLKSYIITVSVVMLSFGLALIGPAYTYLKDGTIVTLYEVRIPFLLEHPHAEFAINILWQLYVSLLGIPALFVVEGMTTLVNNTITVTSKLTVQELEELSDQMEVGEIGGEESGQRATKVFMKIIYMDGYIERFRDLWYWRLFLAPPAFTFAIAVSIYSQYVLEYPAGYGIAVVSYVQMAVLCASGQNIVDRNERILEALYQFKWYLLPPKYQKDVMFMIQHLQNKEGLTMGPFEPLNRETLKILTQKVYSFLMFINNFNA